MSCINEIHLFNVSKEYIYMEVMAVCLWPSVSAETDKQILLKFVNKDFH
jgi:hypothetical protein